jgi:hypothetical protein
MRTPSGVVLGLMREVERACHDQRFGETPGHHEREGFPVMRKDANPIG